MRLGSQKLFLLRWPLLGLVFLWALGSQLHAQQQPTAHAAGSLSQAAQSADQPTLDEISAKLRRLYALREYDQVLSVANEADRYYPGQEVVAYYRNLTLRKKDEAAKGNDSPYRRLRNRPIDVPDETPEPAPIRGAQSPTGSEKQIAMAAPPAVPVQGAAVRSSSESSQTARTGGASIGISPLMIGGGVGALVLIALVVLVARRRGRSEEEAEAPPAPKPMQRSSAVMASASKPAPQPKPAEPASEEPVSFAAPPIEPEFESASFDETFAPEATAPKGWEIPPAASSEADREAEADREVEIEAFKEETLAFSPAEPESATPSIKAFEPEPFQFEPPSPPAEAPKEPAPSTGGTKLEGAVPLNPEDTDLPLAQDIDDIFAGTTLPPARAPWETSSETDTDVRLVPEQSAPDTAPEPPTEKPIAEFDTDVIRLDSIAPEAPAQPDLSSLSSPESWETEPGFAKPRADAPAEDAESIFKIDREEDSEKADETHTSWNRSEEETVGLSHSELAKDPDLILPPRPDEKPAVQVFRADETVRVNLNESEPEAESSVTKADATAQPAAETQTAADADSHLQDPFERARQLGLDFFAEARWDQAVHHLSVAAALRPEAADVKDKLRQARRMRKG